MNDAPFEFQYISGNLSGAYIFNADQFSLRAVYPMNRLQRSSAGSFMGGGKHFQTWSLNFVLQADYLSFIGGWTHNFLLFNSATLGASKRF